LQRDHRPAVVPVQVPALAAVLEQAMPVAEADLARHAEHHSLRWYTVGSSTPASANPFLRSAHLLHAPQCRPSTGRMHENVHSSGSPRPRNSTSTLCSRPYGSTTRTAPSTERFTTSAKAAKNAGVASGNGLLPRGAIATAGTLLR